MRLGILSSHPIQYNAPWFRALAKLVELEVFYAHQPDPAQQGAGFGKSFTWDVDLLSGYRHRFLTNISARPGLNHFSGCDTPEIADIISGNLKCESKSPISETFISAKRFDAFIVMGWYLKTYMQAARACRRSGIPVLVRGDSQLHSPRSWPRRLVMEIRQRWLLRKFDGFLSVGQRHKDYLCHFGVPQQKIFSTPHFVDNEWFAARAVEVRSQKSEIRKKWGISEEAFCALFCGKFIAKKRPMDLVAAARILTAENAKNDRKRPVHLLFVGSGKLNVQLHARCHVIFDAESPNSQPSTLNHQLPAASFAGFLNQSELPAAYAAADVLVLPSDGGETWGLVVNEAMASGLPAIVSGAVGCAPDLIDEGKTGFTFPTGNAGALAERLEQLMTLWQQKHDFTPALSDKLNTHSLESACVGTLTALKSIPDRLTCQ
jgi:glycosyltransferase involved in cell wall biosynthesis